ELAHTVQQRTWRGQGGQDAAKTVLCESRYLGDAAEERALEHPTFLVQPLSGDDGRALYGQRRPVRSWRWRVMVGEQHRSVHMTLDDDLHPVRAAGAAEGIGRDVGGGGRRGHDPADGAHV